MTIVFAPSSFLWVTTWMRVSFESLSLVQSCVQLDHIVATEIHYEFPTIEWTDKPKQLLLQGNSKMQIELALMGIHVVSSAQNLEKKAMSLLTILLWSRWIQYWFWNSLYVIFMTLLPHASTVVLQIIFVESLVCQDCAGLAANVTYKLYVHLCFCGWYVLTTNLFHSEIIQWQLTFQKTPESIFTEADIS